MKPSDDLDIIGNKCIQNSDTLFNNFYQQIYELKKWHRNSVIENLKKHYLENKNKQRDQLAEIFSNTDLKCKSKTVIAQPPSHSDKNTFYFNGSMTYSTFIRIDDVAKILSCTANESTQDNLFRISGITDKLVENLKSNMLRDKKFDYDHYIKNISYKDPSIDIYKPKRQQIFRSLFGRSMAFIGSSELSSFNEIDKLIHTCTIENKFFHSLNHDKSSKMDIHGNELIMFFFHASWESRELLYFKVSSNNPNRYYFLCEEHFYISSLSDFVFETGLGVHIELTSVGDFSVLDDKYVLFLTEDFDLFILDSSISDGNYILEEVAYKVEIPHDDICGCKDRDCIKKVIAHPQCKDHFLVYGVRWCLLFKLFDKKNPQPYGNEEYVIDVPEQSPKNEELDDDDSDDDGGGSFIPKQILCEAIPSETICADLSEASFDLSALEINVAPFVNFVGASFLPYKNDCRDVVLVDTSKFYTFNIDTFKFGPCADNFLRKKDEFDDFVKCEQGSPFVVMQSRESFFYYIWRGKKSLHSKYAVNGFKYNGLASIITEPLPDDEYDFYGIAFFTPPSTQKRGCCELFHRYRQKATLFLKTTEINEIVDMKIRYIDNKSYLLIHVDSKNMFIAPLMRNSLLS